MEPDHVRAHKHSIWHRGQLAQSEWCGCFYCLAIFRPGEIEEWVDEQDGEGTTALCPKCGIDSVIGSASGFPIEAEFLRRMRCRWFG